MVPSILVVDDDMGDIQLVHRALSAVGYDATLYAVQSIELAAQFLENTGAFAGMPRPDLVVLDLHLPGSSGCAVLELMRGDERWRAIPVTVLTLDDHEHSRARCAALGADDFQLKPADEAGYRSWADTLLRLLARTACNRS